MLSFYPLLSLTSIISTFFTIFLRLCIPLTISHSLPQILIYIVYISISLLAILGNGTVVYLVLAFQRMKTVCSVF